jgi:glycosyltransferase involved in cell wall biosynthesis
VNGILVKPDDVEQLARTLSFLARNRKRLRELGRGAHETAMRDFSRPAIRAEITRAFQGLAGTKRPSPSLPAEKPTARRRAR